MDLRLLTPGLLHRYCQNKFSKFISRALQACTLPVRGAGWSL
jgi:hypothetical protein